MSTEEILVELQERTVLRKGLRKLRDDGQIPAVIHDHGKASIHVSADFIKLNKVYAQAGKHHPVQLKVGTDEHLALIKDVDFEPTKHMMRHVVFQAIKQDEKVTAEIPLAFEEVEIPAEKLSLMVLKQLDHVEVECLPSKLPDMLTVNPASLTEVGDHLTVADIKLPEGVTLLTDPNMQIAIVEMPKDQEAEANKAADELAADAEKTEDTAGTAPQENPESADEAKPDTDETTTKE